MLRSILVPLDGSMFAEHALPYALLLARQFGARLRLVQAHEPPVPIEYAAELPTAFYEDEAMREREWQALQALAMSLARNWGVTATPRRRDGEPVAALAREVIDADADMVVMSTHGRGPLARAWLGSVADGLLRAVRVPLLLVRPRGEAVERAPRGPLRSILVPLDGSSLSERVLEHAVPLAVRSHSRLMLLRTIPASVPGPAPHAFAGGGVAESDAVVGQLRVEARHALERVAARLDVAADCVVVPAASPATGILDYAARKDVDLIAMSTHGYGGFTRLLHGSVADKVIRGASTAVLVVRPEGG
ncbi:MAG: universal stress protein [Gemmatimonadetes bacterium]|nr:universal stress protein [Gemmatimonadota bacterium]